MPAEPYWTKDNRHIVWTVGDSSDLYNLYVGGRLVVDNLPFDEWYPIYRSHVDGTNTKKEAA